MALGISVLGDSPISVFTPFNQRLIEWNKWGVALLSDATRGYMAPVGAIAIIASMVLHIGVRILRSIEYVFYAIKNCCFRICRSKAIGVLEKAAKGNMNMAQHILSFLPFSDQVRAIVTRSDKATVQKALSTTTSLEFEFKKNTIPNLTFWGCKAPNVQALALKTMDKPIFLYGFHIERLQQKFPKLTTLRLNGLFTFTDKMYAALKANPLLTSFEIQSPSPINADLKEWMNLPHLRFLTIDLDAEYPYLNPNRNKELPPLKALNVRITFTDEAHLPNLKRIVEAPSLTRLQIVSSLENKFIQHLKKLREGLKLPPLTIEWIQIPAIVKPLT